MSKTGSTPAHARPRTSSAARVAKALPKAPAVTIAGPLAPSAAPRATVDAPVRELLPVLENFGRGTIDSGGVLTLADDNLGFAGDPPHTTRPRVRWWRAPGSGPIDRADAPAYLLCILGALFMSVYSGYSKLIGFPIDPDRLLLFAGLALLVLDQVAMRAVRLRVRPVHMLMGLMLLVVVWSANEHQTLTSTYGFYALLDRLLVPFLLFSIAPLVFATPARRGLLLRLLVLMGLYLGATAVFERVGPTALVWPKYILNPNVGIHYGRARGPFVEAVADGLVMCQCGFAACFGFVSLPGRWRIASLAAASLCGFGLLLTLTRSIWIGGAAGALLVCLVMPKLRRFVPALLIGGVIVVGAALAFVPGLSSNASSRLNQQRPVWDRENTDTAAVRIIFEHPLDGIGWMEFSSEGQNYVRQASTYPITTVTIEVHNVVLSRAAELGVPAASIWIASVGASLGLAIFKRPPKNDLEGWWAITLASAIAWGTAAMLTPMAYATANYLIYLFAGIVLIPYLSSPRKAITSDGNLVVPDEIA